MTTTTNDVASIAADLISKGCPADQAWPIAAKQWQEAIAQHHQAEIDASRKASSGKLADGPNAVGLPCKMIRTSKGGYLPACPEPMAVLVAGGPGGKGKGEFGPSIVLHLKEYATSTSVGPTPTRYSSGSNLSTCEPEDTSAWQVSEMLAAGSARLFVRQMKTDSEELETIEYTDREQWLKIVREEISIFFDDVRAAKTKVSRSRR